MSKGENAVMEYNKTAEANELRARYLQKIREAYERYDFSDLFDDLADDCRWGGKQGKQEVVESLTKGARSMKERNYWHRCTLVQVRSAYSPLEFNTAPDGSGRRVRVGLLYERGEVCMIDETPLQTLFFRMTISPDGKILDYYATLPPGSYRIVRELNGERRTRRKLSDLLGEETDDT